MNGRVRPGNHEQLLLEAVEAARSFRFWSEKLGDRPVRSMADFENLPLTSVDEYRAQTFESVVADPTGVEWVPGPWLGQSPKRVPVAEGPSEANVRVELMADALRTALAGESSDTAALVVVESQRRHFGAEVCAVFVRMGVKAHLLTESASDRLGELVRAFAPDVVVALSSAVDMQALPDSVTGVVTVGRQINAQGRRHIDLCVQNELGVLGSRFGTDRYELNHQAFHFEESPGGTIAVTPYFSRVQPFIRLDTGIPASVLN